MKIAFDVKGTLIGQDSEKVVCLLHELQKLGHHITVWSSVYAYTDNAVAVHNLQNVNKTTKNMKMDIDYQEHLYFDIAIDDDRQQTYLAAKRFIFVDELPELDKIKEYVRTIT